MVSSREAADIGYHLHAYTNAEAHMTHGPLIIEDGDGIYVKDNKGNRYIEAMSGLWCAGLGFSEQRLLDAAATQMRKLPYYHTFNHRSHNAAIDLAEKLISIAPVPMSKAFFTSSGSEAIDTTIKLIWYRSNALGEPRRKKIISRKNAYHGSTVAGASLTGLVMNQSSFDLPIPNILYAGSPHYRREALAGESEQQFVARLADELEQLILAEGPETIAAFIGEPVMGAGGVIVPPKGYWEAIQNVLKTYEILLVVDEIICGFGRTGEMFGSQTFDIHPDFLVLSKQMSSGYVPIAALLINDRVFQPIASETNRRGTFGHGFTSGGHPLATAVALENIRIIEERHLVGHVRNVGAYMQAQLRTLAGHELVDEVRGVGLIAAVELAASKGAKAPRQEAGALGQEANLIMRENGVIIRNLGDAIAFCPPMISTKKQIDTIIAAFCKTLDQMN